MFIFLQRAGGVQVWRAQKLQTLLKGFVDVESKYINMYTDKNEI